MVRYVNVIDCKGQGLAHRKILSYFKEFAAGDAVNSVPDQLACAFLVGVGTIAAGFINTAKAAFWSEYQKRMSKVISGDPFRHSRDFAERFDRATMPVEVGGELSTGDDGHCCIGVAHTVFTDEEGTVFRLSQTQH